MTYHLEANVGYSDYEAKLDIEKLKEDYSKNSLSSWGPSSLFDALVKYCIDYGDEESDISSHSGDYDPYLTEIYVSKKELNILKEAYPDESFEDMIVQ